MIVLKTESQQKILEKWGYNSNRKIQIIKNYPNKKVHFYHIKKSFKLLINSIYTFIIAPFNIIWLMLKTLFILIPWILVYTPKNIKK